ncbi:hypothetical protein AT727_08830 [Desulfitobacterium hafniense]|uniref:Uncharacterized protein n=1 Tax=Desulfitobacterium hafniense TaxID=49338 RepID=A0A0W1JES8_DESHA|nr:hypothetical protein [Desulfitobacterium hafniense]KTE90022.1 hypothetical protein AT727_08830 [Desulfitobacterium hafniense]
MKKIIDIIFPMYANHSDNKVLRRKLNAGEDNESRSLLRHIENAEAINSDILKRQYDDTFRMKDKLEDKAKINVIGITIAITLIMGASGVLNTISEKFPIPVLQWLAFVLLAVAVIYLLIAGVIVVKVLIDENIVYTVSLNSFASGEAALRSDYDKCIVQNRTQNLIRNNSVYSSYECIRNALVCLFIILLLSTIPIEFQKNNTTKSSVHDQYSFTFASETIPYLKTHDVQPVVEDAILNAVKSGSISANSNDVIGIIDGTNNLFIKFNLSKETITVMMIETYSIP